MITTRTGLTCPDCHTSGLTTHEFNAHAGGMCDYELMKKLQQALVQVAR